MKPPDNWHTNRSFKALQKEWYGKLKDEGFKDVEGGVEGHMLQGSPPSLQMEAVLTQVPSSMARAKGSREATQHWLDRETRDYLIRGKDVYYHCAQRIALLSFRTWLPAEVKFTWCMHSDGLGENVICSELSIPRSRARRYLAEMRENVQIMLDIYTKDD